MKRLISIHTLTLPVWKRLSGGTFIAISLLVSLYFQPVQASPSIEDAIDVKRSPVALTTPGGSYRVELTWEPVEIKPNMIVNFEIRIIDLAGNKLAENMYYDFIVLRESQPVKDLRGSFTANGIATHTVDFPSAGSFRITVNLFDGGDAATRIGTVSYDLRVVPEFPLGSVVVAGTLVGMVVALTRFTALTKSLNKGI